MATNLRDLLGVVTTESIKGMAVSDPVTKVPPFPSKGMCVQYISATCGATCDSYDNNYGYYDYPDWQVPVGVSEIIFEIWGGGGGGGNACCCTYPIPGSSGAYAYKKISGAEVVAGCSYAMELGRGGCGRTGPACGAPGGKTFITGHSLTNFCADGGHAGCSCCNLDCCTWKTIDPGSCPGGICSPYYGADGGWYGVPGAAYKFCWETHCWNKQHLPFPAGLVNKRGGWTTMIHCECYGCGYCGFHYGVSQLQWGGSYSENNYVPGVGGPSGWAAGGGCCYGQNGNPGLIRISYKYTSNV